MLYTYTYVLMKTKITPESILQQITQIQRMDRGTVSILRQGPQGPYYNHQCYEGGKNISRYVSAEQVPELKAAIADFRRFEQLTEQYVQLIVQRTRTERQTDFKKKTVRPNSSWPRTRKSNS